LTLIQVNKGGVYGGYDDMLEKYKGALIVLLMLASCAAMETLRIGGYAGEIRAGDGEVDTYGVTGDVDVGQFLVKKDPPRRPIPESHPKDIAKITKLEAENIELQHEVAHLTEELNRPSKWYENEKFLGFLSLTLGAVLAALGGKKYGPKLIDKLKEKEA